MDWIPEYADDKHITTPPQTTMHQSLSFAACRGDLRLGGLGL